MTIEEIDQSPWASRNTPGNFDFRHKTAKDLEPLCFGVYQKVTPSLDGVFSENPRECKIVYGGLARAGRAVAELASLGILAHIDPPHDTMAGNETDGYSRITGWSYDVRFLLP